MISVLEVTKWSYRDVVPVTSREDSSYLCDLCAQDYI